eukprot:TRINITY_DN729_c1_g1_i12.p1 TRINITY_DN729_c1_g1~~TRINITY_DN729_c1_g1_i12.p1  ORF type:complete len:119 (+),score=31.72 TRINITY_DN729_c1_g1_i12:342-698(+)
MNVKVPKVEGGTDVSLKGPKVDVDVKKPKAEVDVKMKGKHKGGFGFGIGGKKKHSGSASSSSSSSSAIENKPGTMPPLSPMKDVSHKFSGGVRISLKMGGKESDGKGGRIQSRRRCQR